MTNDEDRAKHTTDLVNKWMLNIALQRGTPIEYIKFLRPIIGPHFYDKTDQEVKEIIDENKE